MDTARARLMTERCSRRDAHGRLRLYHPVTAEGAPIYCHAKILIADEEVLRVGSANLNNRSMRLDTECDLTVDARRPANAHAAPAIRAVRDGLVAEHLGVDPALVAACLGRDGIADRRNRVPARPGPVASPLCPAGAHGSREMAGRS